MQPSLLIDYSSNTSPGRAANKPMLALADAQGGASLSSAAALGLRLAQRAFAAVIEDAAKTRVGAGTFCTAQLRDAARRTLSALSADDRPRLSRWLILQFAAGVTPDSERLRRSLARLDARLGTNTIAAVEPARAQWRDASDPGAAA